MKEQLITFDTAKLAKEKGFDWETEEFYTNPKKPYTTKGVEYMSDSYIRWWKWNSMPGNYPTEAKDVLCAAPTQSLLQKWLREVHDIHIQVPLQSENDYYPWIFLPKKSIDYKEIFHGTYEEALEIGLQEALKLIKIINMNELITIAATLVKELDKAWLLDCEGDEVWFPKSKCSFKQEQEELVAPKWLLMEKFPGEQF